MKVLLDLKAKFKAAAGKDWKPGQTPSKSSEAQSEGVKGTAAQSKEIDDLNNRITDQGNTVRGLKDKKAPKVSGYCCSYKFSFSFGLLWIIDTITPQPLYNTIVGVQASFQISYPYSAIARVTCILM